jgi:prolyl oligopeptidase
VSPRSPSATALIALSLAAGCVARTPLEELVEPPTPEDLAQRQEVVEVLHGVEVADPYRWMEDGASQAVTDWTEARNAAFQDYTEALGQRSWLYDRFQHLWRYDDESTPSPCLLSDRVTYSTKRADQDKWVLHLREGDAGEDRVLLDPNTWEETETLSGFYPSPDCRYAVYGVARAGDENARLVVMDLDTLEVMDDTFKGWKLGGVEWLHDNSGFYYSGKPAEGEVAEGEHFYWHRAWFHALGNQAADDELVFSDEEVKETWHGVSVSEDGRYLVRYRGLFNKSALWIKDLEGGDWQPIAPEMDARYGVDVVEDKLLITTDHDAPRYQVFITEVDQPGEEHWRPFIPEGEDVLSYISAVGGKIYAVYKHDAATRIAVYSLEGEHLQDIALPTVGSAGVWGHWSKPRTWVSFSSFAHPSAVYTYDADEDALTLFKESPVPVDPALVARVEVEQVWYPSADGTEVSMFIVRDREAPGDGTTPFLLTGYGGFNISMSPRFSTSYLTWIEAGGGVAIPNLRGGGEYGKDWHEAGMREHKQNVFDDFIAAAEYLEARGYTASDRLAISGGSNGGLLVSAAVTQRPELFAAVLCAVPLTDMVRYHTFGLANIWAEEYGSADDPEMFPHIYAYSPYHRVEEGVDYPAILVTGSLNDARTDPVHARKFAAAVRWADADRGTEEPILLHIQSDSGHGGGVTIDAQADQTARHYGFLMAQIGMEVPADGGADQAE